MPQSFSYFQSEVNGSSSSSSSSISIATVNSATSFSSATVAFPNGETVTISQNIFSSAPANNPLGVFTVFQSPTFANPELQYTITSAQDWIFGRDGAADIFALVPEITNPVSDPLIADVITNFHPWEGDKMGLINGVFPDDIFFQVFDANSDGIIDSTLVRLNAAPDYGILAVIWNTVNDIGETTLLKTDFLNLGIDMPISF
jgi:hypothetical protein